MEKRYYVTTPIYYVTARPHLGSLYSTVLADIFARWHRVKGYRTRMVTGTDEHGQKVAAAAAAVGMAPQEYVDSFIPAFEATWRRYEIDYATFIRTTDSAHQRAVVQWIKQLQKQGDIYRGTYEGFYCTPCETFVAEREQGSSSDAPICPTCSRSTQRVTEPCYFFRLSMYQDRLLDFYERNPQFIVPKERLHEVISFVKSGLRDLAVSRAASTVSWGIPFPGDPTQVVYVWADALNNYLSAVGYGDAARRDEFSAWWPAQLQVLGKDIVRFHAVYWPAFLMAAGLKLPHQLLVHGWIQMHGTKMSKSLGNVVDPDQLADTFGVEVIRYYIARHLAVTHDAPFAIDDLITRSNADLADDLGNLIQRLTAFAATRGIGQMDLMPGAHADDQKLVAAVREVVVNASREYHEVMVHRALAETWRALHLINGYLHAHAPWKLPADDPRAREIVVTGTYALTLLSELLWPVMPTTMDRCARRLGLTLDGLLSIAHEDARTGSVPHKRLSIALAKGEPLFPKIQPQEATPAQNIEPATSNAAVEASPIITIDTFAQLDLRVGTITNVELVPKSEKLYKLTVDAGPLGVRIICSGVRAHCTPEELLNKQGLFVANLAPRMMLGIPSQGMMLFVEDTDGKLRLLSPATPVPPGVRAR